MRRLPVAEEDGPPRRHRRAGGHRAERGRRRDRRARRGDLQLAAQARVVLLSPATRAHRSAARRRRELRSVGSRRGLFLLYAASLVRANLRGFYVPGVVNVRLRTNTAVRGWGSLPVYNGPFGVAQAERLLWRAGFGVRPDEAYQYSKLGLHGAVHRLDEPGRRRSSGARSPRTIATARSRPTTRGATTTRGGSTGWSARAVRSSSA